MQTPLDVLEANQQFYVALNATFIGDIEPMKEVWSHGENVAALPPSGERLDGWDAALAHLNSLAEMNLAGNVEAHDVRVHLITPGRRWSRRPRSVKTTTRPSAAEYADVTITLERDTLNALSLKEMSIDKALLEENSKFTATSSGLRNSSACSIISTSGSTS